MKEKTKQALAQFAAFCALAFLVIMGLASLVVMLMPKVMM